MVSLVMAGMLAVLLLPGAPAAAAADLEYWTLRSDPVTVVRDGVRYKMRITAGEQILTGYDHVTLIEVLLWRTKDPSGPALGTQSDLTYFYVNGDTLTHRDDLTRARLLTGARLGDFGKLDLTFTSSSDRRSTCGDQIKSRTGTLSGTVAFRTQTTAFGQITNVPDTAKLSVDRRDFADWELDHCPGDGPQCSEPKRMMNAESSGGRLDVTEADGAAFAAVTAVRPFQRLKDDGEDIGTRMRTVESRVPAENFSVAADLSGARLEGEPGTFLRGVTRFAQSGSVLETPQTCGGIDYLLRTRQGTVTSSLRPDFLTGTDRLFDSADQASAARFRRE